MAQDFGDDIGEMLVRSAGRGAGRILINYLGQHVKDWYAQLHANPEDALDGCLCLPFGNGDDAAYFAQVCRENGVTVLPLADKEGNGYLFFKEKDLEKVKDCAPQFSEVMAAIKNREITERLANAKPLTEEQFSGLTQIKRLPDLPPIGAQGKEVSRQASGKDAPAHAPHVHDDRAEDGYNHTKAIRDKVLSAREQCRDYDDFKEILAADGIGVGETDAGELMFYEARIGKNGTLLPYDHKMRDWAVGADTLKTKYGVDATHDWFAANTPKVPQKDLQLICNAVRADLEQQGIQTFDRADGKMGFLVHRGHEQAVIKAVENRYPGHSPEDLGIKFIDPHQHDLSNVRIPTEPQVADGSKDMDGRTPDIDQGIESHDGRDTNTQTFREEYEATSSGDVAPSEVREQADARGHDGGSPRVKDVAKECRDASRQLEKESGITDRDIDISDKFNQIR